MDKDKIIKQQEVEIKALLKETKALKSKKGGRPSKFTDIEKASMQMYRLQGKTVKEIAKIYKCSTRTVDRVLKYGGNKMVECQVEYKNVINKDNIKYIKYNYVNMKTIFCAEGEVKGILEKINIAPYLIWDGNVKGKKVQLYELTLNESDIVRKNKKSTNLFKDIYFDEIGSYDDDPKPVEKLIINEKNILAWKKGFEENIDLFEYVDNVLTNISDCEKYSKEQICNIENEMIIIKNLADINDMSLQRFLDTYYK